MIKLENVNKVYSHGDCKTNALKNINLTINSGEFVSIMGTSGSGKSSLLNIIGCMDVVSTGKYYYNDVDVSSLHGEKLHLFRKNNISFVFQNFALMSYYTVYENVEVPLLAKGISKAKRKEIIMDTLEKMQIKSLADKLPIHISSGQQQRCGIARAIVADNNLILADEPTGALDKNTSIEIMNIFSELNKNGKTIILVTHDENVANLTNKIIRIEDGQIL